MPRGDKEQIMRYSIPKLSLAEEACIGNMILSFCTKINVNRQINDNLRASRAQNQTQFELCRGAVVNADISPNLSWLDRSSAKARARCAA